jgi:copper chaperone CopZ
LKLKWWVVPMMVGVVLLASYGLAKTVRLATQTIRLETGAVDHDTELETVEFEVHMLKCWTMSNLFTEILSQVDGVVEIQTFVRTNTARITFDPAKTSPDHIADRINQPVHNPETGETLSVFSVEKTTVR